MKKTTKAKVNKQFLISGVIILAFCVLIIAAVIWAIPGTSVTAPVDNPPVLYNDAQTNKMMDIVENRRELSASDQEARTQLTTQTNPLVETSNISAEYVSAPDEFMVEILTTDIDAAKQEAVDWFTSKGLSSEAICHLPLVFYLNYDVAQSLRDQYVEFDPLPPGC